jgi:tRNA threonylcarbamoyladenosine biosynthesis protein TsaE
VVARTGFPDDTRQLAAAMSAVVRGGDLVVLGGDLGSGKTTFAQGFAKGLGVTAPVTSPTFTLVHHYPCPLDNPDRPGALLHADLYRLDKMSEVADLGLGELLEENAVAMVEWGDAAAPALGDDVLDVRLEAGDDPNGRIVIVSPRGASWADRCDQIAQAVHAWTIEKGYAP